ncbi:GNAT family N-acetyltransferase [Aeoliella mucimassa]|uniref:BioF2-like acetyltransferase domain-containing protein n=1 Tax=Aeoliella mucimassa TaxID=2527972 RepID=A0A518ASL4_9BACT|nr:GNAT family N-acetyltransferase [Aeoliella mucimassa]QDU57733.1 hypothetical protein Pan181_39550 [Aeoliella mucimassa]
MAEVQEINDLRTLANYRLLWNSLLEETPNASFHHTFEWLENFWRHDGSDKRLRVLIVRVAGQAVGILPLCVIERRHRLGTLDVLTYPLDNWASFYGPIGKNQTATLMAAMRYLASTPRDWDQIDLGWTDVDAVDHGRTRNAMRLAGLAADSQLQDETSVIDLAAFTNGEEYLASLSKKTRHELRRHERRVSEFGEVTFERHRPGPRREGGGDERWDLYDECEQIASTSWQSASTTGNTLSDREYVGFFRDCHAAAARQGMVDMALLRLAGKPVAFWYGYQHQGRLIGMRMGYDPSTPVGGVGNVLLKRLIADSIARGDQHLDMGVGGEQYKLRLRTGSKSIYHITHTPTLAVRPQMVRAARWLKQQIAAVV